MQACLPMALRHFINKGVIVEMPIRDYNVINIPILKGSCIYLILVRDDPLRVYIIASVVLSLSTHGCNNRMLNY